MTGAGASEVRVDRRRFLVGAGAAAAGVALATSGGWWRHALAVPAAPGPGPYGPLATTPDANGLLLPEGFESRTIAISGEPVSGTDYVWHAFPDGGATFRHPRGGWVYVSNSEVPTPGAGGVGAVRFAKDGEIVDAYRILDGTQSNCAGGATPWKTWLSGEEHPEGHIWECDPMKPGQGTELPGLGTFSHEAAAVDPVGKAVYLTEDHPEGRVYRFVPTKYPDLTDGTLQALHADDAGRVTWIDVSPDAPERSAATTAFDGGEGMVRDRGAIVFTTKGDDRVWALDTKRARLEVLYDAQTHADPPLTGVDNITVHPRTRDLYVAEDGGNLEVVVITQPGRGATPGEVAPVVRVTGPEGTELAGIAFDPSGRRLYVSSQRQTRDGQPGAGITFEVRGPFT
jgi:secreted PhoX family phosphatase